MGRKKAPTIAAVTPELLAMTWDNENSCRMWLRRRGQSPSKLGFVVTPLMIGPEGSGVGLVRVSDVEALQRAQSPSELETFEAYAEQVDTLLQAANEEPEFDAAVLAFMERGCSAQAAVEEIIVARAAALVPDVVRRTAIDRAEAPHKDSEPVRWDGQHQSGGLYFVQLGLPMEEGAANALAAKASKALKLDVLVCSSSNGAAVHTHAAPVPRPKPEKKDHFAKVLPLLERADGASVDEVKRAIGWKTAPGKWFFEKWALEKGRERDLVDMGHVDGVRRFRLRVQRGARR